MARKRAFLDDGDSDSVSGSDNDSTPYVGNDDPDERAERELFENSYGRKRQRRGGKEDAIYGVFGDDSEDEGFGGRGKGRAGAPKPKRSDWAKAPAFVPKQAAGSAAGGKGSDEEDEGGDEDADEDEDMGGDGDADTGDEDEEVESAAGESRAPSPRVRDADEDEEMDERPRFGRGGLGLGASKSQPPTTFSGFTKAGIGASRPAAISGTASPAPRSPAPASSAPTPPPSEPEPEVDMPDSLPSAFGGAARAQRSFVRSDAGPSETRAPAQLSTSERTHFSKLKGSFGARMLEKMGWQTGAGLGTGGEGIVTPVESKLRPKGMGIAYRGFGEKTEQSKSEARRRGEVVSDDEDAKPKDARKAAEKAKKKKAEAWQKPKKVKVKVQHKTYEEIVADAGQDAAGPSGIGVIIDATGATPREVSSLAEVSIASWTPSTDSTRIPEVRHNIRLIAESATADLKGLAQEANEIRKRRRAIIAEDARLRKRVADEAELIARMQEVRLVADEIQSLAKQLSSVYEATLDPLSPYIEKLVTEYPREFDRYRLDELVVAAMAPIVRRSMAGWKPLEEPELLLDTFRLWRSALKVNEEPIKPPDTQVGLYGATIETVSARPAVEAPMTPFESLLWNVWLPRVRSAINNDWDPADPAPAVRLYEAWARFLPPFIRDNFLDQLVLPKLSKALADWRPSSRTSLRALVFPWLPHAGLRLDSILSDALRRLKSVLRAWLPSDALPADLDAWRTVLPPSDWDSLTLKYVLPKLGATLRDDLRVNPREQDMAPLAAVLAWTPLLRASTLAQLLAREFFPQWLGVLHFWLVQPRPSFEEVARWLEGWQGAFPDSVRAQGAVQAGFTAAFDLVNKAIDLGSRAAAELPQPEFGRAVAPAPAQVQAARRLAARTQEVTFRAIAEEYAAGHNLLFVPTQRVHEQSRVPLIRVSPTADGRGGVLVYILDDAVWAPDPAADGEYRAVSLETMVLRANGKS
ncbi:GC-rich sequence DNA-binding factor-like protein-domain-containing protein [Vararia minispora EC-137]|uniref:GC-rich sequence DNA-binding factor-like protein-domain-containing protein n=1 Tax=Vararia minispora EC-137 TaxID=1314806 RepID=A0ACB8QVI7_9AGAM|nr:GC-rich sequence DNA-binding factor-like protein-domain-containing protein [Vararia minispora EC-137]